MAAKPTPNTPEKVETAEIVKHKPSEELLAFMADIANAAEQVVESEDASLAMIERILSADKPDDVFVNQEATKVEDLQRTPVTVTGFSLNKSDFTDGSPAYAVIDCTRLDTGKRVVLTCGSKIVLASLWKLKQLDAFPCSVIFAQSDRQTRNGYYPINMFPHVPEVPRTGDEPF